MYDYGVWGLERDSVLYGRISFLHKTCTALAPQVLMDTQMVF